VLFLALLASAPKFPWQTTSQAIPAYEGTFQYAGESSPPREYLFSELGVISPTLSWQGLGSFSQAINETFDLSNKGPVFLVLEFSVQGDKPSSPGYRLTGSFNEEPFEVIITRAQLSYMIASGGPQQLVIPFEGVARFLLNHFYLNLSCTMESSSSLEGSLTIHGNSKFLVGNVLVLDSFGNYPVQILPATFKGYSSIGSGMVFKSFIQVTIENESLVYHSGCSLTLTLELMGQQTISLALCDKNGQVSILDKNTTADENTLVASTTFTPYLGVSIYELEVTIFGSTIWSTEFEVNITQSVIHFYKKDRLFGFDTLEIPFFVWPSVPLVGILVLTMWFLPYTILKYREWKKSPYEVNLTGLEDADDDAFNVLDPEGYAVDEPDDDFDDTLDSLEDD